MLANAAISSSGSYQHVDGGFILDIVVRQGAAIFEDLGGTHE